MDLRKGHLANQRKIIDVYKSVSVKLVEKSFLPKMGNLVRVESPATTATPSGIASYRNGRESTGICPHLDARDMDLLTVP